MLREVSFPNVRHGKDHGTLRLTSKHILFQKHNNSSQETDDQQPKPLKLSWTQIAKCPVSPKNHPKALLRIVSHSNKSKTFEFDNRTELLKAKRNAQQRLNECKRANCSSGSGANGAKKMNAASTRNTISTTKKKRTSNKSIPAGTKAFNKEKSLKKQATIDSVGKTAEDKQTTAKAGDTLRDEERPYCRSPKEAKMDSKDVVVGRPQKYLAVARRTIRPALALVVAILWLIFYAKALRNCFLFQVQLKNRMTGEPIEETMRGYGYFVREMEPGQESDYGLCVRYTPVEINETFNDTWFSAGKAFAQMGLITGILFCWSLLLVVFPAMPFPFCSQRGLAVFLYGVSFMSQGLQFLVFGTNFCATHICKVGPGTGSACLSFTFWAILGFVWFQQCRL